MHVARRKRKYGEKGRKGNFTRREMVDGIIRKNYVVQGSRERASQIQPMPQLMKHRNKLENGAWSNGSDVIGKDRSKVPDRTLVPDNLTLSNSATYRFPH